jgi:hypothetical protein
MSSHRLIRRLLGTVAVVGMCGSAPPSSAHVLFPTLAYLGPMPTTSTIGPTSGEMTHAQFAEPGYFNFQYSNSSFAPYILSLSNDNDPNVPSAWIGFDPTGLDDLSTAYPSPPGPPPPLETCQLSNNGYGVCEYDTEIFGDIWDVSRDSWVTVTFPIEVTIVVAAAGTPGADSTIAASLHRIPAPSTMSLLMLSLGLLTWIRALRRD